jgi:hypothetical protein
MNAIDKTSSYSVNSNTTKTLVSDNFNVILKKNNTNKAVVLRNGTKITLTDFKLGRNSETNKEPQLKGCTLEVSLKVEDKNEFWKQLPNGKINKLSVPEQDGDTLNEYTYRYTTKKAILKAPEGYTPYLRMVRPAKNVNPRWNSEASLSTSIQPKALKAELSYSAVETPAVATYNRHFPDIFTERAMNPDKDIYFEAYCEQNPKNGSQSFKPTQIKNVRSVSKKEYFGN